MNAEHLRRILHEVKQGSVDVEEALNLLRHLPYEDLGYARLDHHRALRQGFPEVVYCQGKTREQVVEIVTRLARRNDRIMATRAGPQVYAAIREAFPQARYHKGACIVVVQRGEPPPPPGEEAPYILVVSGGTADLPVAEEAAVTAQVLGSRVERLYDVGVAGLHRLLDQRQVLFGANVVVAVAGMEGTLPGIVAGLVASPVIALPTSVGYGTGLGGLAALSTMLNACAPGIACVNIDNGFGAGFFAHLVNERMRG